VQACLSLWNLAGQPTNAPLFSYYLQFFGKKVWEFPSGTSDAIGFIGGTQSLNECRTLKLNTLMVYLLKAVFILLFSIQSHTML
jgi:hypothetical protein